MAPERVTEVGGIDEKDAAVQQAVASPAVALVRRMGQRYGRLYSDAVAQLNPAFDGEIVEGLAHVV